MGWNVALTSLILVACVTINVYFPAAAAEKAADQIIDRVTSGATQSGSGSAAPAQPAAPAAPATQPAAASSTPPKAAAPRAQHSMLARLAGEALDRLIPAAYAQANANLDITSSEIRVITASMQARFDQLEKYFASGAVGLTNDGLIELRDAAAVPLAERAVAKRLVAEDNRDRAALYTEIARANEHPEWETDIRKIFARRWVERGAKPGWYYQNAAGAWAQK
jgi:uncharacterized protein YdbL (DUF1318 family)